MNKCSFLHVHVHNYTQAYVRKHPYRALLRQKCTKDACYKPMKKGLCRKSGRQTLGVRHGLINNKDTKTKCRHLKNLPEKGLRGGCLLEFIDWGSSQSCWYFRPSFVNCCPSNLLSGWLASPPPPHPSCVEEEYIQTVSGWEGVEGVESYWRPYSAGV